MRIEPFQIDVPAEALDDLRRRIAATRWPSQLPGVGWDRGVPLGYLAELAEYWRSTYDWRAAEARLNRLPQFVTTIDGTKVHFFHLRSPEPDALPLLLTHGWPGSSAEFTTIVERLADPRVFGDDASVAFHVVVPSIPGYGFSGPTPDPGWDPPRIARAWAELMGRLGYARYAAHGGDFGAVISLLLSRVDPAHLAGVHVSMLPASPAGDAQDAAGLSAQDLARLDRARYFDAHLSGYMKLQSTRPQTLAYALTDSPVGQLAWIVEKFKEWTHSDSRPEEAVDRDQLLTNVTIYWLTATAGSSAQLYYEIAIKQRSGLSAIPRTPNPVPLAVAVFSHDILPPIRRFAERDYSNIIRWSEFPTGGHFAAMEEPDLLVTDLREFRLALP